MTTKMVFHGSDIEKICSYYHLKKEDIIKFGANVNPLGLSENVKKVLAAHIDIFSSYPDRNYTSLRNVISEYCDIPADFILPGNGSSELISLLIEQKAPKKTLILGPTYSEYSRELSFSGSTQEYYHLQERDDFSLDIDDLCHTLEDGGYDFLILCNPNNPTSSAILQKDMRKILAFCEPRNIFVMIDETYVEFAPDISEITAVPLTGEFTNLMVLRGVSKFFAAPGMRLGYGITGNMKFLSKMKEKQTPWSLNSLGAYAGELMLQDSEYINRTRNLILSERDRLYKELQSIPEYKVFPAYANFLLLKIQKPELTSSDVFESCIKKGLMIRDCASFQCLEGEFVRFCIMMPEDNSRLIQSLRECVQK
ncbi:pyridoxal phosphate-dependent aminotransferase [Blautia sp. HCP28S3_G10]|uniref:pyridoxal phosphate-dependent aminotransferase n=1 Tax=Blautia sp. HCP28S3_G10 TaxID=3438908 RepID=UPI003F8A0FF3